MNSNKKRINHTGSAVAQDNKVRVSRVQSPLDSKNILDSDVDVNSDTVFGSNVKIMALNIEGILMAKCDYLSSLLRENNTDILLHIDTAAPPSRYQISGFLILMEIDHRQYGTMTYLLEGLQTEVGISSLYHKSIHISEVQIKDINILNVYKP